MGMQIYSTKDNQWREYYNPLRGLSIPRLALLLEAGERGQYADLQWFYYYMERTDPMVFSVLQRRRAALLDCDWDVRKLAPEPGVFRHAGRRLRITGPVDDVLAQEQVDCLRAVYDGIENFDDAVSFLFTGVSRGFAHLEKNYAPDGEIVRLEPVEQWFWLRDGMFAGWEYNQNAVSGRRRGQPIDPDNFLVLETMALNRMWSLLYLRRVTSQRDWDAYLDLFGIPPVFLIGPPNAVGDKEKEYQAIAADLFSNGRGYLPNGSDIKFVNGGGGRPPYRELLEYIDRQITLIGTGGLLTMLTESGSGTLAGGAHSDTFQQIARGDASMVSDVFQRGIDVPVLAENFPGQPVLAFFQFAPTTLGAASAVAQDVAALAAAGFTVDPAQVSEKTGYRMAPGAPVNSDAGAAGDGQS
jgi:phage gp29-like protein